MEEDAPRVRKTKKKKSTGWLATIGISLILTAVVLVLWFLLRGETTVTGGWTESVETVALSCEGNDVNYPIFSSETKGSVKINAIFGDDKIDTISLIWRAQYENDQARVEGQVKASRAMEEAFVAVGMAIDSLDAVYSGLDDDVFQMSLYGKHKDLDNRTYKFFMLSELTNGEYSLDMVKRVYKNKSLNCVVKD